MKQFGSFSDAIRYGATLKPQAFCAYVRFDGATCAVGAGLEALLGRDLCVLECLSKDGLRGIVSETNLWGRYGYLRSHAAPPCGCERPSGCQNWDRSDNTSRTLFNLLVHLNNEHQWTREQIADWLQSEEDKLGFVTLSVTEESQATLNLKSELSELGEVLQEATV